MAFEIERCTKCSQSIKFTLEELKENKGWLVCPHCKMIQPICWYCEQNQSKCNECSPQNSKFINYSI